MEFDNKSPSSSLMWPLFKSCDRNMAVRGAFGLEPRAFWGGHDATGIRNGHQIINACWGTWRNAQA